MYDAVSHHAVAKGLAHQEPITRAPRSVASVSPVLHPKSFESKENTEKKEQYMPLSQAAAIFYVMYMHSSTLLDVPCTMIGLWHSCHKDLFARGNLGVSVGCSPPAP